MHTGHGIEPTVFRDMDDFLLFSVKSSWTDRPKAMQ